MRGVAQCLSTALQKVEAAWRTAATACGCSASQLPVGLLQFFWCLQGAPQKVTIGLAHSTDGLEWTKVQGPGEGGCILERGAIASNWDHEFIMSPSLVQGADGMWQLHYFGGRMSTRWGSTQH